MGVRYGDAGEFCRNDCQIMQWSHSSRCETMYLRFKKEFINRVQGSTPSQEARQDRMESQYEDAISCYPSVADPQ